MDTRFRWRLVFVSVLAFVASLAAPVGAREQRGQDQGEVASIPSAFGESDNELLYTPVTPCRVFDSRISAGGPGPLQVGIPRDVLVAGTLGFPAQGGFAGGCGIPGGATAAVINFVAVSPSGTGNLRAYAVASPQPPAPLAATINYAAVQGLAALANGIAVPLCNPALTSCAAGDLRLEAFGSATDVLGDVVGYFRAPATCGANQVYKTVGGVWTCAADVDTNTTYSAAVGGGLSLSGTTFSTDTTVQRRTAVSNNMTCPAGQYMRTIAQTGQTTCVAALSCTRLIGTADAATDTASCSAGTIVMGGGCSVSGTTNAVLDSYPIASTQWFCRTVTGGLVTAYAICCDITF